MPNFTLFGLAILTFGDANRGQIFSIKRCFFACCARVKAVKPRPTDKKIPRGIIIVIDVENQL
jgi:hypothetical protein